MLFIKISLLLITSMYLSASQNPYINHIPKSDGLSPKSKNNLTLKKAPRLTILFSSAPNSITSNA